MSTEVEQEPRRSAEATEGGTPLLELRDLHVYYGAIEALKGVSLTVGEGEVVALLGANGAGKSTTLKTASGMIQPRQGQVLLRGERVDGIASHGLVQFGIGHVPEGRRVFARMTVRENLKMGAYRLKRPDPADLDRVFTLFPRLADRRDHLDVRRPDDRLIPPTEPTRAKESTMSHSDFTAIVTGAASTRGIGRGTALALAADGWNVAILDLDEAGAKEAADEVATDEKSDDAK